MIQVQGALTGERLFEPSLGVVLYEHGDDCFASVHAVLRREDAAPELGPGQPLTMSVLRSLTDSVALTKRKRAILPDCVLVSEFDQVAWWRPAKHRPIFINSSREIDGAATPQTALHPPLLFIVGQGLRVFALGSNERPRPNDGLLRAPYWNVNPQGVVCRGNVPYPKYPSADLETIEAVERAFFCSDFTHTSGGTLTTMKGGHAALWQMLVATPHRHFPHQVLLPSMMNNKTPMTLEMAVYG